MFIKIDIAQVGVGVNTHRSSVVTVIKKPCHFVVSFAGRDFGTSSGAKVYHPLKGRRDIPLTASSLTSDNVSSHEALASMIGYGFILKINPETGKSELWVDGVHARDFFETLEMRYRKMIVSGEELVVNNGGVVSEVLPAGETFLTSTVNEKIVSQADEEIIWPLAAGDERLTFVIKGEAGIDYQMFVEDDILRYTWRDKDTGLKGASGYLLVRSAIDEFTYTADILEGSPEWLKEGMTLALFGNLTNKERQGFIVLSARERTIAIYDGVNSARITPDNLKVLLGNLSGVVDPLFPEMKGSGLYSSRCYLKGSFFLRSGENLNTLIPQMSIEIDALPGKFAVKVEQSDFDELTGVVAGAEASISAVTKIVNDPDTGLAAVKSLVDLKATASDLNVVSGKVTTAEASISAHASILYDPVTKEPYPVSEIRLKANMIMVEGLLNVDGTIKTDALVCDGATITRLHAVSADIEGTITATSGRIYSLIMGDDYSSYMTDSALMYSGSSTKAFVGKNTANPVLGFDIPAWFEGANSDHTHQAGGAPNIGVYLRAQGTGYTTSPSNQGNHAAYISAGDIYGFAVNTKRLYYPEHNNITLHHGVTMYACYNNGSEMTINLPAPSVTQIGKIFHVKQMYRNVRINGTIYRLDPVDGVWLEDRIMATFINDGNYWHFAYSQA